MRPLASRLLRLVAVLLAVTAASFSMVSLLPGDMVTTVLGANATEEDRDAVRAELLQPAVFRLFKRCDALRRPERFALVLQACACDARGRLGLGDAPYPQAAHLQRLLDCALSVDTQALSTQALAEGVQGVALGRRIEQARVHAMARAMKQAV